LEKLKTLSPHLIILDLNMPKMGGLVFYQRICDYKGRPKFPIFILSARANMTQLFKEFNIEGFMTKPFEVDELLAEVDTIINKTPGKKIQLPGEEERAPKVCLVDSDPTIVKKIGGEFSSIGYVVTSSTTGTEAIEHVYETLPDIVLVKLALEDIAGDMVILQLKRMAKTRDIKYILYTEQGGERTIIIDKISKKEGIDCFLQYSNVQHLVNTANTILKV
jgi:DNA-binding response OmpR family regulator